MKNEQVINNFIDGIESKNKNVFSERDSFGRLCLYSYGYHFPMALKLSNALIVNLNKYSMTTSRHQGILNRAICGEIIFKTTNELKEIIKQEGNSKEDLIEVKI